MTGNSQWTSPEGEIRVATEMMFFPSLVAQIKGNPLDPEPLLTPTETYLREFLDKDRIEFDREFAKVFGKMLEIGVSKEPLTDFLEPKRNVSCSSDYFRW